MKCLETFVTDEIRQQMEARFFLAHPSAHERRVLRYAIMIFTILSKPFHLGKKKRSLLYYAALLHDIGYEISARKHDAHSRYLILNDPFFSFWPQPERTMLALIAGGHRKKLSPELDMLSPDKQFTVRQLAAILRIADAIDYPRDESLEIREITLLRHQLNITVHSRVSAMVVERVAKKSLLFKEVFEMSVMVSEE